MALGERDLAAVVVEEELEVAEVLVEAAPVLSSTAPCSLYAGQTPVISSYDFSQRSGRSAPCRRACSRENGPPQRRLELAAAGPGRPSPRGLPSSSIIGITSRIEDDVNASSAAARSSNGVGCPRASRSRARRRSRWCGPGDAGEDPELERRREEVAARAPPDVGHGDPRGRCVRWPERPRRRPRGAGPRARRPC